MIYEIRTYRLKPGSVGEVEKRYGEALPHRQKYSDLATFWHTEIGPLNEIVHVWPYADLAERARVRAAIAQDPNWPPRMPDLILTRQSEILVPFPFSPALPPGAHGPYYELRYYTIKAGALPGLIERWASKIGERTRLSPLASPGTSRSERRTVTSTSGRTEVSTSERRSGSARPRPGPGPRPGAGTRS